MALPQPHRVTAVPTCLRVTALTGLGAALTAATAPVPGTGTSTRLPPYLLPRESQLPPRCMPGAGLSCTQLGTRGLQSVSPEPWGRTVCTSGALATSIGLWPHAWVGLQWVLVIVDIPNPLPF